MIVVSTSKPPRAKSPYSHNTTSSTFNPKFIFSRHGTPRKGITVPINSPARPLDRLFGLLLLFLLRRHPPERHTTLHPCWLHSTYLYHPSSTNIHLSHPFHPDQCVPSTLEIVTRVFELMYIHQEGSNYILLYSGLVLFSASTRIVYERTEGMRTQTEADDLLHLVYILLNSLHTFFNIWFLKK